MWRSWLQLVTGMPKIKAIINPHWFIVAVTHSWSTVVTHHHWFLHQSTHISRYMVIFPITDRFSKSTHFITLPKLPSAFETAQFLHMFHLYGIPCDIVSDRGPQLHCWSFSSSLTSSFHSQSNGQAERCNQELEAALRCVNENNPSTWCQHLS